VESFLSQRVVACPGRGDDAFAWLLDLVRADGGTVVFSTAAEHDHLMTTIQAIRHFATFSLGTFLAAEHPDIARTLEFSSPIYRLELDMVCRLFAQDAGLYIDIMTATDERRDAIARLAENAGRLARLVHIGDRASLVRCFDETAHSLGPTETARALDESARVIRALATILAADRVNKPAPAP
jgi:prephenate dehydrogenase/chorismate mutase/prephenate dehydrogenase